MLIKRYILIPLAILCTATTSACETLEKNEVIGGMVSGATCAAISKLSGSSDRQAIIAAAVCASVGYAVTKELEDDRRQYASDEDFYNQEMARLEAYDKELTKKIGASRTELTANKAKIDLVIQSTQRSEQQQDKLVAVNAELSKQQAELIKELELASSNLDYQKGLNLHMKESSGSVTPEAESQLATLESSVQSLEQLVNDHEQQTASLGAYI